MARVQIIVTACSCDRCGHEWLPRSRKHPSVCPRCKSPYWDSSKRAASVLTYEDFRNKIRRTLKKSGRLTWKEIRERANLPQWRPSTQWIHRMRSDIGLETKKDPDGITRWQLR